MRHEELIKRTMAIVQLQIMNVRTHFDWLPGQSWKRMDRLEAYKQMADKGYQWNADEKRWIK